MNRREFLLLPLALSGCASVPGSAAPTFGRFTSAPKGGRVTFEVHFHDNEASVRTACAALNQRAYPDATAPRPPACTSDTYTPGFDHVHVVRPRDWDDHDRILQLGHEVLHTLGANHR